MGFGFFKTIPKVTPCPGIEEEPPPVPSPLKVLLVFAVELLIRPPSSFSVGKMYFKFQVHNWFSLQLRELQKCVHRKLHVCFDIEVKSQFRSDDKPRFTTKSADIQSRVWIPRLMNNTERNWRLQLEEEETEGRCSKFWQAFVSVCFFPENRSFYIT